MIMAMSQRVLFGELGEKGLFAIGKEIKYLMKKMKMN